MPSTRCWSIAAVAVLLNVTQFFLDKQSLFSMSNSFASFSSTVFSKNSSEHDLDTSVNQSSHGLCTRSEIRQGEWIPKTFPRPIYVPNDSKRCLARDGIVTNTSWKTHSWRPFADCDLLDFTKPDQLCQVLGNRSILMVGDSLMKEMFHSILHRLGLDPDFVKDAPPRKYINVCANSKAKIASLDVIGDPAEYLKNFKPNLLIMNRGAHYANDEKFAAEMKRMFSIVKNYQVNNPSLQRFFWKTTTVGHPNCWEYSAPVNNATTMANLVANRSLYNFHPQAEKYRWWLFAHQNQLILNVLDATNMSIPVDVIDGYDLLLRRPDQHRGKLPDYFDCLHHCQPGPQDVFTQLLFHYLHMTTEEVMDTRKL